MMTLSAKSTMSMPQFHTTSMNLHHHGRFYGNTQQLGNEVIRLSSKSVLQQLTINVMAKDMTRLEQSMEELNSKIDENKQQVHSFIRTDLGEIIHQQLNSVLDSRYGRIAGSQPSLSNETDSTTSGLSKRDPSSPTDCKTNDNAGDDVPPSDSSSSSDDDSSDSSVPPELIIPSKHKKKHHNSDNSIPSTIQISSASNSTTTSETNSKLDLKSP